MCSSDLIRTLILYQNQRSFFVFAVGWECPLELQKLCQNKVVYSRGSSLVYLSFKKGKKRRFGTAVPTVYEKNKKHGIAVLFCVYCQLGLSPQTRIKETFREKFL